MIVTAQGDWVVLMHEDSVSKLGLITNEGDSAKVVSVGIACPDSIKELQGKRVMYSQKRTLIEIKKYKVIDWRDILFVEE